MCTTQHLSHFPHKPLLLSNRTQTKSKFPLKPASSVLFCTFHYSGLFFTFGKNSYLLQVFIPVGFLILVYVRMYTHPCGCVHSGLHTHVRMHAEARGQWWASSVTLQLHFWDSLSVNLLLTYFDTLACQQAPNIPPSPLALALQKSGTFCQFRIRDLGFQTQDFVLTFLPFHQLSLEPTHVEIAFSCSGASVSKVHLYLAVPPYLGLGYTRTNSGKDPTGAHA